MISVHLYGKLRRYSPNSDARAESVAVAAWSSGCTVADVAEQLGISRAEIGSNVFLNGRYATLDTLVADDDRLGLFPVDMQLLYKWYFAPTGSSDSAAPSSSSATPKPNTGDPKAAKGRESED